MSQMIKFMELWDMQAFGFKITYSLAHKFKYLNQLGIKINKIILYEDTRFS
jgi:hypothetical protein